MLFGPVTPGTKDKLLSTSKFKMMETLVSMTHMEKLPGQPVNLIY
jgi:hypothetical protein